MTNIDGNVALVLALFITPSAIVITIALLRGYSLKLWRDQGKDKDDGS